LDNIDFAILYLSFRLCLSIKYQIDRMKFNFLQTVVQL
jgi:hypothetical protein